MSEFSSYYLYQHYEKLGNQDWIPCYPNTFSMSGDSSNPMPFVVKVENDQNCGYVPKGSDDYNYEKWEIADGYICDDTTKYARERKYVSDDNVNWTATDIYRRSTTVLAYSSTDCGYDPQWDYYNCSKWEVVSNDYICNEGNKYQKLRKYFRQCEDCDSCSAEWVASDIYKQGNIIEYNSTDCGYVIGIIMYRWITVGYYCVGYDKHYKQQKQISYYQGQIWENLNIFRDGGIYQKDSSDCMSSPVIYRWLTLNPSTDYYCSGTTKYYKEQYQKSYDNGTTWVNEVPPVYKWGTTAETQSTDCGYIPPQYRWYPSGTTCVGYDKWEQSIKQVSYDSGTTWINVDPTEYSATTLIEADSEDCGWSPTQYRWIQTTDTMCVEEFDGKLYAKYSNGNAYELPCDGNSTLTESDTSAYTSMVEAVVGNCVSKLGVVQGNWGCFESFYNLSSITISNSVTIFEEGSFFLNTSLVKMNSDVNGVINLPNQLTTIGDYAFSNCSGITTVNFPNTLTSIGTHAFQWCDSLSGSINIPDSVTSIGEAAFAQNGTSGVTSVTIGSGITSIGSSAFYSNRNLQSITILATTPPTLHLNPYDYRDDYTFDNTNNCPIYVPADSVNAYKTAELWTKYASRIQAIS